MNENAKIDPGNPLLFITHSVWYPDAVHLLLVCAYDTDKEIAVSAPRPENS